MNHDFKSLNALEVRQLDGLVAEIVMGWTLSEREDDCSQFTPGGTWNYSSETYTIMSPEYWDSDGTEIDLLPYRLSTDWEGVGLIVIAMDQLGYRITIRPFYVTFDRSGFVGKQAFRTTVDQLPKTIAIAALLTILQVKE